MLVVGTLKNVSVDRTAVLLPTLHVLYSVNAVRRQKFQYPELIQRVL